MSIDTQIAAALLTVLLTFVGAIVGYIFREYKNKAKPFVAVTKVEGNLNDASKPIDLTADIVDSSKTIFDITGIQLNNKSRSNEITKLLAEVRDIIDNAPEFLVLIEDFSNFVRSNDSKGAQGSLVKIMENPTYDQWMVLLIGKTAIPLPQPRNKDQVYVEVSEEHTMHNGCYALKFSGRTITFGSNLKDYNLLKRDCRQFVSLIEYSDFESIQSVFLEVARILRKALDISRQIEPKLKKEIDAISRWGIKLYIANLGQHPFLINRNAQLYVENQDGAKYVHDCFLVVFKNDEDGLSKYTADAPVVVQSAGDVYLEYVTAKSQSEMGSGGIFREVFSSGKANCWITFSVEKVGFIRKQVIKSPKAVFQEI